VHDDARDKVVNGDYALAERAPEPRASACVGRQRLVPAIRVSAAVRRARFNARGGRYVSCGEGSRGADEAMPPTTQVCWRAATS